ncbi:hypothetical protein AcV5_005507 [Taiwanofungus camphoratus]|nr:hypothetical protein AcV5_005507 [Antrodia cinnamomea]
MAAGGRRTLRSESLSVRVGVEGISRDVHAEGSVPGGSGDDQPPILEGIEKDDSEQLLRVLYPRRGEEEVLQKARWYSVQTCGSSTSYMRSRSEC